MLRLDELSRYLSKLFNRKVEIIGLSELGEKVKQTEKLKEFGYGKPYLIKFKIDNEAREVVLSTIKPSIYDHHHFSDRARILLWQHYAFNKLPNHVKSIDVGAFTTDNRIISLGKCKEFFILMEKAEGELYHKDLDRMRMNGKLLEEDLKKCKILAKYLAEIHSIKGEDPSLYLRKIRELIGHGECIMGLIDSYPRNLKYIDEKFFIKIEKKCIDWRWKMKNKIHRLSQVHGDFHPWNIMFKDNTFTLLDRSRGEYGEPADDVTALTINYIFYSLQSYGKLAGPFERLFMEFWKTYLNLTKDHEILEVVQPFYTWRTLVIASPIWYPKIPLGVRLKLFKFIENMIQIDKFNVDEVNRYLEG